MVSFGFRGAPEALLISVAARRWSAWRQAHYSIILQLLQHADMDVNQAVVPSQSSCRYPFAVTSPHLEQVDKFEWPPILEACSRLPCSSWPSQCGGLTAGWMREQQPYW